MNIKGQKASTLLNKELPAGSHSVEINIISYLFLYNYCIITALEVEQLST